MICFDIRKCSCLLGLLLVVLHKPVIGQSLQKKVAAAYQQFEQDKDLKYASVSFTVLNAQTGETVFAKNEALGLATASTLKTITSAAAYHILGADYSYQTQLLHTGKISDDGVLLGDIIIRGSGDPSLASNRFETTREALLLGQWTAAIKAAGIKKIEGSIIADDAVFGGQTAAPRWIWQDLGSYYGAGPSGLNWRENLVDIQLRPASRVGETTTLIATKPNISYIKVVNESTTGAAGSGDKVYPYAAPYSSIIYLRGTYGIDMKKNIQAALPDAAYDAALRLQLALEDQGITVNVPATTSKMLSLSGKIKISEGKLLITHNSPALKELVYWFNQKSINLYGESFLKTMAIKQGKNIDTENAAQLLSDFWASRLGIPKGALRILDGSGLSPENRVTTDAMARILASAKKESWFDSYYKSFPTYNGMRMKSGTIGGVLGYTGYHKNALGTELVFSLLVNNYEGTAYNMRQKMFKLLNTLK
ncbi:D-alanyl-D-alanine carboxypeptidase/D-alanyl-D-alanine-endopeptidase [Olivibacter sp. SDN3]|nr:D-alanyl-D-alanine carboxypeptidase/D-alanyl-D-alanine-endopeptidase [Olivibacter sp. SDN3]